MLAGSAATIAVAPAITKGAARRAGWYRNAIVIDGLGDLGDPYGPKPYVPKDQLRLSNRAWTEMRATGVTALRDTIDPIGNEAGGWEKFKISLSDYHNVLLANSDHVRLVESARDIVDCKRDGMLGIILGTQDTAMVGPVLDRLAEMKKGGLRCIQLTYNLANLSGDGSIEPRNGGLTNLGRDTVRRIEAEDLLLDLAHGGARTIDEAIAYSKRPLTISHTGARALTDNPRNVSDAAIRAIADKGGVVGVYFKYFLSSDGHPTGGMLLDHIDHIARTGGEDHVSIGTDLLALPVVIDARAVEDARKHYEERKAAGISAPGEGPDVFAGVRDYDSIDKLERLGNALMKRGWTTGGVEKLLGLNLLRLYADVWGG